MPIPDFRGRPVLVTGGAGFIGSHLVDALVARGARVRVLDNLATGHRAHLAGHLGGGAGARGGAGVELIEADLRDRDACRRACDGVEVAFHLAALGSVPRSLDDPATTVEVNVAGTAHLFDAARRAGVGRVVWASSSSVYGSSPVLPRREGEEGEPRSPYAASKAMAEQLARAFAGVYGLPLVGLRYFNVYGPRQDPEGPYAAVVPCFFREILAGRPPVIDGDGEQSRDFTFVADAVRANLLAAGAALSGTTVPAGVYNVASGTATTINRLAALIAEVVGSPSPAPIRRPPRAGDVRHSLADLTAVAGALGYAPEVSLAEGLRACLAHYRSSS